jgi:hypothetical protein
MTYEDFTLQRIPAQFAALYSAAVKRGVHRRPGLVYGIHNRDNSARGYELAPQVAQAKTMAQVAARTADNARLHVAKRQLQRPEAPLKLVSFDIGGLTKTLAAGRGM